MVISEDDNESCSPRENSDDAKWEFRRSRIKSTLPEKIVFLVDIHWKWENLGTVAMRPAWWPLRMVRLTYFFLMTAVPE